MEKVSIFWWINQKIVLSFPTMFQNELFSLIVVNKNTSFLLFVVNSWSKWIYLVVAESPSIAKVILELTFRAE